MTPLREKVFGDIKLPLLVLMAAVAFVLLIACVNVAHMMLARATGRQKEIAVRAALGANRLRIIRQALVEALLLATLGAVGALLLAAWGTRLLVAMVPAELPGAHNIAIDLRVMIFLAGLTVLTAIAFGLAPALQAQRVSLSDVLSHAARGSSEGRRQTRVRSLLLASEFALALMLLAGAGLLMRSFRALQSIDPGFNPHNLLSMVVSVKGTAEALPGRREVFYRALVQKVSALPGVESASGINHLPLVGDLWGWPFRFEGRPKPKPGEFPGAVYRIAMPGYFHTMQVPLLRGRDIARTDTQTSPGVVVVNEAFVRKYFSPGEDPMGKRIAFGDPEKGAPWVSIVGVAKDARQEDWAETPDAEVYLAALQNKEFLGGDPGSHISYITLVARTTSDPSAIADAVKSVVRSFNANLPISLVITMEQAVREANAQPRFELTLIGIFAGLAVLLAAVGIFGVMSYAVSRRTHEIGIRMSLGATTADLMRMVLRNALSTAAIGALAGLGGALLLARLMRSLLYGVRPSDPITMAGAAVLVIVVALVASYIPARSATQVDPTVALRHD